MGCLPVIISDAWVEPPGPDWASFSVRIPESQVREIPAILAERERDADAMRIRCREAFNRYFADEALFNYMGDCLASLIGRRRPSLTSVSRRWRAYATTGALEFRRTAKRGLKAMARRALDRPPVTPS